jgi:tetratricopeptide (TPR) repeat protein
MAADDGERRMVFDIRGRRKNVVKVVYAVLAILMGTSLFLVIGPFNIAGLFEDKNALNAASQFEDQAEKIERKLKQNPQDEQLLLALTRARINAGNGSVVSDPATGQISYTPEMRDQFELASEAWSKYLAVTDEPSPSGAQLAANAFFSLAQVSRTGAEIEANLKETAAAQRIVAEARPSLGSLSSLATYLYYSFDYKGAEQARKKALTYATSKFEREKIENDLDDAEKQGRSIEQQLAKFEKEAKEKGKTGESALGNPLPGSASLGTP